MHNADVFWCEALHSDVNDIVSHPARSAHGALPVHARCDARLATRIIIIFEIQDVKVRIANLRIVAYLDLKSECLFITGSSRLIFPD